MEARSALHGELLHDRSLIVEFKLHSVHHLQNLISLKHLYPPYGNHPENDSPMSYRKHDPNENPHAHPHVNTHAHPHLAQQHADTIPPYIHHSNYPTYTHTAAYIPGLYGAAGIIRLMRADPDPSRPGTN